MDLTKFKQKQKELETAIAKDGQSLIATEFEKFFAAHPEIHSVQWTQFTPFFNDGEPCRFSRHEFYASLSEAQVLTDHEDNKRDIAAGFILDENGYYFRSEENPVVASLDKSLSDLNEPFYDTDKLFEAAFGDGVQVTASREGFEVEDYNHD